jgi:hypothetical protein
MLESIASIAVSIGLGALIAPERAASCTARDERDEVCGLVGFLYLGGHSPSRYTQLLPIF